MSLLPFLEIGKADIFSQINDTEALETFPEMTLIEAGLRNGSEHWSDCALDWLKGKNTEVIERFDSYLKVIFEDNKRYGQPLRHKAKALLKVIN